MLSDSKFKEELIIHWYGPPTGKQCNKMLEKSLDVHFEGKEWHFFRRKERPEKLKTFDVSKAVDKFNETEGRLRW